MLSKVKIRCYFCYKQFLTKRAYVVFNKNAGYHSFCSKKCLYESKMRGKVLSCENPICSKKFYRAPNNISSFNYCSKSCAAIVNNQKYPKYPPRYCAISVCKNLVKREDSVYCSVECGKLGRFKYTREEIIKMIQQHHYDTGRIPSKRELGEVSHKAIHMFTSWNNAILAAGLTPNRSHDNRMYKRLNGRAVDGHLCDSVSEILIDNWLAENKIPHTRDARYPTTNHKADWAVNNGKIFIEYFGLAKDSPRYDREIKLKKQLCKKSGIKLIEIYPKNLYPINRLDEILRKLT